MVVSEFRVFSLEVVVCVWCCRFSFCVFVESRMWAFFFLSLVFLVSVVLDR